MDGKETDADEKHKKGCDAEERDGKVRVLGNRHLRKGCKSGQREQNFGKKTDPKNAKMDTDVNERDGMERETLEKELERGETREKRRQKKKRRERR